MAYYDKNETICQAVHDYVIAEYVANNISLPSRRMVGYAGMPLDCEMFTTYLVRMYQVNQQVGPDSEGQQAQRCTYWAGSEIEIALLRCTPVAQVTATTTRLPTATAIAAFARLAMRDPHIIARGVRQAVSADALGLGANVTFGDTAPIGDESGGLVGLRLRLRVGHIL